VYPWYSLFKGIWEISGHDVKKYNQIVEKLFSRWLLLIEKEEKNPFMRMIYVKFVLTLAEKADRITNEEIEKLIELHVGWGLEERILRKLIDIFNQEVRQVERG